ncbi:MAG: DUF2530 domain-containing protein, partial [Jiangellaceae bacterium]
MGNGRRRPGEAADVQPLDVDGVRTVAVVTVLWAVAFVALALRKNELDATGNGWWLWTCLAGVGLGLLGLEYTRKRRDAIALALLHEEAADEDDELDAVADDEQLDAAPDEHHADTASAVERIVEIEPSPEAEPATRIVPPADAAVVVRESVTKPIQTAAPQRTRPPLPSPGPAATASSPSLPIPPVTPMPPSRPPVVPQLPVVQPRPQPRPPVVREPQPRPEAPAQRPPVREPQPRPEAPTQRPQPRPPVREPVVREPQPRPEAPAQRPQPRPPVREPVVREPQP